MNAGKMLSARTNMRNFLLIVSLIASASMNAQNKNTIQVLANSRLLESTVFGTKDSVTLENLFATPLVYVHSSGSAQTRQQAIHGISNNKSTYVISNEPLGYEVQSKDDSLVVTHVFKATEKKTDGTETPLDLTLTLVWAKEKGKWKLYRRQAVKNH
jgi:ketosteroid isomerase-like protein